MLMSTSHNWPGYGIKLFAGILGAGLVVNFVGAVVLEVLERGLLRNDWEHLSITNLDTFIGVIIFSLPFLVLALWPLAYWGMFEDPDLDREELKAICGFTALLIVTWAPVILEIVIAIRSKRTTGDGGGGGFALLLVYLFTPLIIACTRVEERLFTSVSVRIFGQDKHSQPRTVPTVATMLVLNLLQTAAILYFFWAAFLIVGTFRGN